jgi:hypothetical protein
LTVARKASGSTAITTAVTSGSARRSSCLPLDRETPRP